MRNINKILAINFGGIGDEILFLPTLISLKKEFPKAKITLALEKRSKGIMDLTDIIDEIIVADIKKKNKYIELLKLILKVRFGKYDIAISSGANKFISIILYLTGIKLRFGYDSGNLSKKILTKAIPLNKDQYAVKMYHDLITPITNHITELPQINISPQEKIQNSVLVHPGVSKMSVTNGMIKTIASKTWAETINLLIENNKNVILVGGPDDEECINEILQQIPIDKIKNMYGKTYNLKDLANLIGQAEIFLCSDSAPLHIAVALNTKTFAIFGPTDDKKLIPPQVTAIKVNNDCPLKPCLWERRQKTCESLDCLKISAQDIVNTILK